MFKRIIINLSTFIRSRKYSTFRWWRYSKHLTMVIFNCVNFRGYANLWDLVCVPTLLLSFVFMLVLQILYQFKIERPISKKHIPATLS
jgi:cell shape-determining protein MreD